MAGLKPPLDELNEAPEPMNSEEPNPPIGGTVGVALRTDVSLIIWFALQSGVATVSPIVSLMICNGVCCTAVIGCTGCGLFGTCGSGSCTGVVSTGGSGVTGVMGKTGGSGATGVMGKTGGVTGVTGSVGVVTGRVTGVVGVPGSVGVVGMGGVGDAPPPPPPAAGAAFTCRVKVLLAEAADRSVAVITILRFSTVVGVPLKVRVTPLKVSQAGSGAPLARVAV